MPKLEVRSPKKTYITDQQAKLVTVKFSSQMYRKRLEFGLANLATLRFKSINKLKHRLLGKGQNNVR